MTKVKIGNLQLEASDRYDPVIIASLEQHVTSQIQESKPYDKEANLFLLKLYQFNTSKTNVEFVKKVLILALMYGGATNDFTLATYLIQDKQQTEESIIQLSKLSELLETCQFDKFWEQRASTDLKDVASFDTQVRKFITGILAITYQETERTILKNALNIKDDKALDEFIKTNKDFFKDDQSTVIRFSLNQYNQILPKKVPQNIKFEQVVDVGRK